MRVLEKAVSEHPVVVLLALGAATLALAPGLLSPRFSMSMESFVPDEDAERIRYSRYIETFGSDYSLVAIFRVPDAFSDEALAMLRRASDRLQRIPGVEAVYTAADAVRVDRGGPLPLMLPLVRTLPLADRERDQLRQHLLSSDLYRTLFVSENGRFAGISVILEEPLFGEEAADEAIASVARKVGEVLELEHGGFDYELIGVPVAKIAMAEAVRHDLVVLTPGVSLLCLLFLWVGLRGFYPMAVGASAIVTVLVCTMSLFFLAGRSLSISTALLPSLVIAISIAHVIFIVSQYRRCKGGPAERAAAALRRAAPPCFMAAITTAAGFLSLVATNVAPVREFGLFAAVGIILAFAITLTMVPAMLRLRPDAVPPAADGEPPRWIAFLERTTRRRGLVTALAVAVALASAIGIADVRVKSDPYAFFPPDHYINTARDYLEELLGATNSFELMIRRRDGGPIDGDALAELARLRDELTSRHRIVNSLSILSVGQLIFGDEERFFDEMGSSDSPANRALLVAAIRNQPQLSRFLTTDGRATKMTVLTAGASAEMIEPLGRLAERLAAEEAPSLEVQATGQALLISSMIDDLFFGQVVSVGLILLFVTAVFLAAYRSLPAGLIGLVANVTPIVVTLGLMGWLGIPLNIMTIMVASIAIGIAVDDTIHFVHQLRRLLATGADYDAAVDGALRTKGRPILFTSLLLAAAFLTLTVSGFAPTKLLGALTATTMLAALLGDLVLLPALLRALRPRFPAPAEKES